MKKNILYTNVHKCPDAMCKFFAAASKLFSYYTMSSLCSFWSINYIWKLAFSVKKKKTNNQKKPNKAIKTTTKIWVQWVRDFCRNLLRLLFLSMNPWARGSFLWQFYLRFCTVSKTISQRCLLLSFEMKNWIYNHLITFTNWRKVVVIAVYFPDFSEKCS